MAGDGRVVAGVKGGIGIGWHRWYTSSPAFSSFLKWKWGGHERPMCSTDASFPVVEDFEDAAFSLVWDAFPSFMFMFGMAGRLYCTVGVHPTRCKVCSLLTISTKAIGFIEQTGGLFSLRFYNHCFLHVFFKHFTTSHSICTHNDTINLWFQEFEKSGDPDKHLQELLKLAKEGAARGKVSSLPLTSISVLECYSTGSQGIMCPFCCSFWHWFLV